LIERIKDADGDKESDFSIASLYARLREKDKAFEHLERSFQKPEWQFAGLQENPNFDALRDDPDTPIWSGGSKGNSA